MATVLDRTVQALADVTGFIVDRSVVPEKLIGQGWIISKSRMVVLASSVANYADAPWALLVKFPYPDLTFSVKAISLHPEFNKRVCRDNYLAQANELNPQAPIYDNDIATITLDAEIPDLQPDRVLELNRALSLPLTISAQDLSGVMRAGETGNILQKAIVSGRNGVLNFYDERKVPFCRVLIKGGKIIKATFQNLQNEFAVCELMWRKPGGNFVLQSADKLSWGAIPDIQMSTEQLAAEASRRMNDLPRMLDALGGPNARYVRTKQQLDMNQINAQIRWVVERIWQCLDGALPLTKMSERLSIDTYTAMQALWEMKHLGLVAQATGDQYHRSGQLGPPLTPGHEVDLKFWDNLQGFFLDELSTSPVTVQGNYFGSTHLLQITQLLHTMTLPAAKYGAIVLKDGRLIGLHNGKFVAPLQNPPPFPLSQMSWIGSLSDMSAKRMRGHATDMEIPMEGQEELPNLVSGRGTITGMKARSMQTAALESGAVPGAPPSEQAPAPAASDEPEILQKFSKIQILGAGGGMFLIGLLMSLGAMMAPKPQPVATNSPTGTGSTSKTAIATPVGQKVPTGVDAIRQGVIAANFKDTTIPPFTFVDTTKETAPKLSFGMESEQSNQRIYFVVWPNPDTTSATETNSTQPPFTPLRQAPRGKVIEQGISDAHNFYWKATRYWNKEDKDTVALVGAFPSTQPDKSILVVALPYKGEGELDYRNTINTVTRMFNENAGAQATGSTSAAPAEASAEELEAYRQKVGQIIKEAYKAPLDAERSNRCVVNFSIDESGNVTKLELKYSSGMDEVDKAVQKAITSKAPFPAPPKTRTGTLPVQVNEEANDFSITEP